MSPVATPGTPPADWVFVKRILVILAFGAVLAACGSAKDPSTSPVSTGLAPTSTTEPVTPTSSGEPTSTTAVEIQNAGGVLLGAYVEPRGEFTDAGRREAVVQHETAIGRPLDLVNEFFSFEKPWAMDRLRWHLDNGRGLMISWNGTHAETILEGGADTLIRERARWTAELEEPLLLRFFWEPGRC